MTPREIDAKLAEAIGCKVVESQVHKGLLFCACTEDGIPPHGRRFTCDLHPYYSAPTWETSGQLIEGLSPNFDCEINTFGGFAFISGSFYKDNTLSWTNRESVFRTGFVQFTPNTEIPKAIAEAARLAFGIEAPS